MKQLSEANLALYARYIEHRAAKMPDECTAGPKCWVEIGPPGISAHATCVECGGKCGRLDESEGEG